MAPSKTISMVDRRLSRTDRTRLEAAPASAAEVDVELVDEAVRDLNAIYTSKALETACVIGSYVIDRFFGGRMGKFAMFGDRHASFRALAKHPDLKFSATYLWTAVAVVGQLRELPKEVGSRLPLSHHRLLLPLKDSKTKCALARRALERHLSKRELAREIGRLGGRRLLRRSRKTRRPAVLKAMSHLAEASEDFVRVATSDEALLGRPSVGSVKSLLSRLELDLDAVRCTVEMLRARLGQQGPATTQPFTAESGAHSGRRADD